MRQHAVQNGVLEIHLPRLAAGLDGIDWNETKEMLLEVFRDQPLRISVYTPSVPMPVRSRDRRGKRSTHLQQTGDKSAEEPSQEREGSPTKEQECEAEDSDDTTLPYGLVERLAGHDLLNVEETQSLMVH